MLLKAKSYFFALMPFFLAIQGCEGNSINECDPIFEPGLYITVVDAATELPLSCDMEVRVLGEGEGEVLQKSREQACSEPYTFEGAFETAGTFQVMVEKTGYETWLSDEIELRNKLGSCHIDSKMVHVELRKSEP